MVPPPNTSPRSLSSVALRRSLVSHSAALCRTLPHSAALCRTHSVALCCNAALMYPQQANAASQHVPGFSSWLRLAVPLALYSSSHISDAFRCSLSSAYCCCVPICTMWHSAALCRYLLLWLRHRLNRFCRAWLCLAFPCRPLPLG